MRKLTRLTIILVFVVLTTSIVRGQVFPKPVGFVNDFARVLPAGQATALESKLRSYQDATGIELAVVTIPSLDNMSVEEYANKLFREWGIGEKGKDNGVLVLLAPTEHKVRIEVGYGIEPDLTDISASQIIREFSIPNFKENKWLKGISATVDGVVSHLGQIPYEARIRARAEKKKKLEEERARAIAMTIKALTYVFLVVIALIIVLGPPAILIYRRGRRKVLREAISKTINDCEKNILAIRRQLDLATEKLDQLASEITKKEYSDAKLRLHMISDEIWMNETNFKSLSVESADDLRDLEIKYNGLDNISKRLAQHSPNAVIYNIEDKIRRMREAEKASQELLFSMPDKIKKAQTDKVVQEQRINEAEEKFKTAESQSMVSNPDWLAIYALLMAAGNLLVPPSHSSFSSDDRSHKSRSSSYGSSYSSSSSSGSDSGSSFGGFGGGSSGGGGASGSW